LRHRATHFSVGHNCVRNYASFVIFGNLTVKCIYVWYRVRPWLLVRLAYSPSDIVGERVMSSGCPSVRRVSPLVRTDTTDRVIS